MVKGGAAGHARAKALVSAPAAASKQCFIPTYSKGTHRAGIGHRCALTTNTSQTSWWNVKRVDSGLSNFWSATSSPTCSDDSCVFGQDWIYDFKVGSDAEFSDFKQSFTVFTGTATAVMAYYGCAFRSLSGSCYADMIMDYGLGWQYSNQGVL